VELSNISREDTLEQRPKTFLSITVAAGQAGCSPRHFRRIIEGKGIPVIQIRRKFFILDRDFQKWKTNSR
jgi:hypothetical protein